jgi:type IV secretory pathway VirB10-like protein
LVVVADNHSAVGHAGGTKPGLADDGPELEMIPPPPKVARYRRNMVVMVVAVLVVAVVLAFGWGLTHGNHVQIAGQARLPDTISDPESRIGDDIPKNYAELTALQRRQKTDQNRKDRLNEALTAEAASDPQTDLSDPSSALQTGQARTDDPIEKEQTAARSSGLFFRQDPNMQALARPVAASSSDTGGAGAPTPHQDPLYGDRPIPPEGQGGLTEQKNAFMANGGRLSKDYVSQPLQTPVSAFEVQAGSVIAAALLTAINSDLPGEIVAQVTEPAYDTATGHHLLVPQGSRLIGKYDSLVSYGQSRALVLWNRLVLPNGKSIDLEGMPGTDEAGTAGLEDDVDHHRSALVGALFYSSVMDLGPSLAQSLAQSGSTNIYTQPTAQMGSQASQMGNNILQRELNRPNTITVRQGWPLRVLVNKDIVLEEYR